MRSPISGVSPPPLGTPETWLVVETPHAFMYIDQLPRRPSIVMARFRDMSGSLVDCVRPDWILCPLFTDSFDAFDILRHVSEAEHQPNIGVLTQKLPNGRMVEEELKARAGPLNVRILAL
ncbi:hypothetical protein [Falsirhodobacter deserti]|uniref:hypothetical protein n=1 Tax=Falsirhodobacter deserti TaxID=1365611 RepID=UPI0019D434BB|nr:hypothetical protein [Falsirhodobacter deserti]